jgi:glycosyltransferase involved in cell wall biosynthesis
MSASSNKSDGKTLQMKRIAVYMAFDEWGGAESVTLNLAQGFLSRGYAVDVVIQRANEHIISKIPKKARIIDLNVSRTIKSLFGLARYLMTEKPDALLSIVTHTNVIALIAQSLVGFKGKVMVVEHNAFSPWNEQFPPLIHWLLPRLIARCYPWAESIVAVSSGVADDLCKATRLPRKKVQIIPNPVITEELRAKARIPLNHPWYAPGQPPVLLAVGRLSQEKDFATLIRAFARLRSSRPVRLLILGEGYMKTELEALINSLGLSKDIDLPGFVQNPYPYMVRSSMLVLSSLWEGLPTVLIEALYCGTPVVATDCVSGPREILSNGKYGKLVPVADPLMLAQAMENTLDDNVLPAPEESWKGFDLDSVLDRYLASLWSIS